MQKGFCLSCFTLEMVLPFMSAHPRFLKSVYTLAYIRETQTSECESIEMHVLSSKVLIVHIWALGCGLCMPLSALARPQYTVLFTQACFILYAARTLGREKASVCVVAAAVKLALRHTFVSGAPSAP